MGDGKKKSNTLTLNAHFISSYSNDWCWTEDNVTMFLKEYEWKGVGRWIYVNLDRNLSRPLVKTIIPTSLHTAFQRQGIFWEPEGISLFLKNRHSQISGAGDYIVWALGVDFTVWRSFDACNFVVAPRFLANLCNPPPFLPALKVFCSLQFVGFAVRHFEVCTCILIKIRKRRIALNNN